jgi:hypothetical protein
MNDQDPVHCPETHVTAEEIRAATKQRVIDDLPTTASKINRTRPRLALRPVRITLELIDPPACSATAIARSDRERDDGTRLIRVGLRPAHLLVQRALHRADTLHLRFLVGLSLVEYCLFWWNTHDGKGVADTLHQAAGYTPNENAWGSGFASRLAISPLLLPIEGRSPSDIPRLRTREGSEPEAGEPIPKAKKVAATRLSSVALVSSRTIKAALEAICAPRRASLMSTQPSLSRFLRPPPLRSDFMSVLKKC